MGSTNILGVRNNNTILSYQAATKRTKQMDFSAAGLITSNRASWVTDRAVAIAYADSLGNWRLCFNIKGTCTANASNTLSFSSTAAVVFAAYPQAISVSQANSPTEYVSYSNTVASSGNLDFGFLNSTVGSFSTSGDVELASKPTWADANMEGVTAVDVLIQPATDTVPGLLSYYEVYSPGSSACTGAITSSGSWTVVRVGDVVKLRFKCDVGSASSATSFQFGTAIPARFRPINNSSFPIQIMNNGLYVIGACYIPSNTGVIGCYAGINFTDLFSGNTAVDYEQTISWLVV